MAVRYYTRRRDIPPLKPGQRVDFRKGKGYFVVPAPPKPKPIPPPPKPIPAASIFSGKGMFTTSDPDAGLNHPCAWYAMQADPEGAIIPRLPLGATACWWMARPTVDMAARANEHGVPFIAQAETQAELDVAMGLLALLAAVPHALVGNPSAWNTDEKQPAANESVQQWIARFVATKSRPPAYASDFDLLLEWYWNEQPSYSSPDAGNYPRFRNVVFGTYPAENPAHRGNRVAVYQYRQVWKGPFSCWPAEAMTEQDWKDYDAA